MSDATGARADVMLGLIYDDVDHRLNPDGEECPTCGGDGYIADCFDGLCINAEFGCDDCTRRCVECARFQHARLKAVREEVIKSGDIDIAIAWLKEIGSWNDRITREQIKEQMDLAAAALTTPDR